MLVGQVEQKHLFADVYDEYLMYAKKEQKEQSFSSMKYKFQKHILPYFKDFYIEDITSKDILGWENHILTFNYANNHVKNLYYILSGFLEYCSIYYNFDKSIISRVGCFKPKYEEDKSDFYTIEEFNTFIKGIEEEVYKQFFTLLFYTGLRPGEAMALQFKDLDNGYIKVTKTMSSHGKREITTPKTRSSIRNVKIDTQLEKSLLSLKDLYISKGITYYPNLYIFGGNKPLSPSSINRRKIKACEKMEIRPITLHQFRHSHATLLLNNDIVVTEVSRRLGHSKVSTTLDIYSHTDLTQEKRVFDTLNSLRFNRFSSMKYKFKSILKRMFPF